MTVDRNSRLVDAIGGFAKLNFDARTDLPLDAQVRLLMAWACDPKPEPFRRSVPVSPYDHDVLITQTVAKLVMEIERLRAAVAVLCDGCGALRYLDHTAPVLPSTSSEVET